MIRKWMSDYIERWNNHDARAISLLFEEDADFIGGSGGLIKGRSEIEKLMAEGYLVSDTRWMGDKDARR
jgi:uncharacterized protein (TIGR02246 family)